MKKIYTFLIAILFCMNLLSLKAQDVTSTYLSNNSFEGGTTADWTWIGAEGAPWLGPNTDGDDTKDGLYIGGIWANNIGDVEFSQTARGLTPGYYVVKALMTVSNNRLTTQRLFAASDGSVNSQLYGADTEAAYSAANLDILGASETYTFAGYATSSAENGAFKEMSVLKQVTGDTLTLGIRLNGKGSSLAYDFSYSPKDDAGFFKFDYFTLFNVDTATFDDVSLSVGSLDAAFDPAVYTYSAILPKLTASVTPGVVYAAEGISATGLEAVDVSSGTGTSTIEVTCLNGSKKTYTINYSVLSVSNDADLSDLSLSAGTLSPSFSKEVTSYTGILPLGTVAVTPTATVNNEFATITSGDGEVTLTNGHGKSEVLVTAEDGTTKTYTIVYDYSYLSNPSFEEGVEGNPAGWTVTGTEGFAWVGPNTGGDVTKDGSFTMGVWNGTIGDVACSQSLTGLDNGTYMVTAYMVVRKDRETTQRLYANSNSVLYGSSSDYPKANLDTLGMKLNENLAFGDHSFSDGDEGPFKKLTTLVEVTDGNLELGVKLNGKGSVHGFDFSYTNYGAAGFSKWDNFTVSNVSDLVITSLSIDGNAVSEIDNTSLTVYQMGLPTGTTDIPEVVATVEDATAKIEVVPAASLPGATEIIVTAADSSYSVSYFVEFTVLPSSDATLSGLSVDVGTLSPEFDAATTSYYVLDLAGTDAITVTATANDANATVEGDGLIDLSKGDTTVTITVTAEDLSKQEYTVSISVSTSVSSATANQIIVYPTVSSGRFYVNVPVAEGLIEVFDLSGKKILSRTIEESTEEVSIDKKGFFIIKVSGKDFNACVKVLKQ